MDHKNFLNKAGCSNNTVAPERPPAPPGGIFSQNRYFAGGPRSGVSGHNREPAGGPDPRWSDRENECGGCRRRLQEADAGGGGGGGGGGKEAR